MNLDNTPPPINHNLTQQINDCFMVGLDRDFNIVKTVDHERLTGLLLGIINELADRVAYLETQQQADDTIQDYMWQQIEAAKKRIDGLQRQKKLAYLLRPKSKNDRHNPPAWVDEWIGEDE